MQPTAGQQIDFLFRIYFGTRGDKLDCFIARAYRDMNRTLRGIAKLDKEHKEKIDCGAKRLLKERILNLGSESFPKTPALGREKFDKWHSDLCLDLKEHYKAELGKLEDNKVQMTYGQAQKWVNMTLKYCWVFGAANSRNLNDWYSVAHIPVDEIILDEVIKRKFVSERPCRKWSAWDSQEEYQAFQETMRKAASEESKTPLELEYVLWQRSRSQEVGDENLD